MNSNDTDGFLGVVEASVDPMLIADAVGRILYANPACTNLFGYAHEVMPTLTIGDLIPEHLRECHAAHLAEFRGAPRSRPMGAHLGHPLYGRRADGTLVPTEISLSPLGDGRVLAAVHDISQRVQAEVEQRSVTLQAREAFYEHVRAVAAQQVARDALGQAEAHRERVATLVRAGAAAPVELMRVDAGVAAAQVAVAQADMGVALTLEALRALTHVQGQLEVRVAVSRSQTVPVGTLDELQEMAERERPELVALASLRDARGHQLRSARGAQYPRLAVQANFVYANPNPRVFPQRAEFTPAWDVSAVVSWSLQQTLDARQQAQSAQAQLLQLEADVQRVRDGVRLEVASAYHQLAAAEQAVMAAQAQVRAADESYRLRWAQLEAGTVVQSDVVDARLERAQAHVALLNAEIGELLARVRLRHAVTGVSAARDGAASTPSAE